MKALKICLYAFMLTTMCACVSSTQIAKSTSYYTKANIWYENAARIFSTNYHVGCILPVGTKINILRANKELIVFRDERGATYTIYYMAKFNGANVQSYLDFYFSEENVLQSAEYKAFTEEEKANIAQGSLKEGMSKAASLMAYGIPPSHRTPSTDAPVWTYWVNRFDTTVVTFGSDDTITKIVL